MKKLPIFGSGISSYSQVVTSQRRLNCFYDMRKDGDKNKLILRGTPGLLLQFSLLAGPVRGWHVYAGVLYVVAGAVLYKVSLLAGVYTPTVITSSLQTSSGYVEMADNGVQLGIVDGTAGYTYTFIGGAFAVISDGNFPNGATTLAFMDGWFVANQPNALNFYISNSYAGTTWTPPVFGAKANQSDFLLAVNNVAGILIFWGVSTTEFWQDVGSSPLPFQRINGATAGWGLAALASRVQVINPLTGLPSIAALAVSASGTAQVIMLVNGYTPVRISDSDIENIINGFSTYSDAVALSYTVDGHVMYQITFPTGGRTFVYDMLTSQWLEAQTGVALQARHQGNYSVLWNGVTYISDYATGNVYTMSGTNYTDNGMTIKRQAISRHVFSGGNPFSIDGLYLDMETGVGTQAGQGKNPMVVLQTSKDGGRTFGYERWAALGKVGQYFSPRVYWRRMGQAKDFVFKITMTDPVKFTIVDSFAESLDYTGEQT